MKKSIIICVCAEFAFLCALIAAFHLGYGILAIVFKVLASLSFNALGFLNYRGLSDENKTFGKFMFIGFVCSLYGDAALAFDEDNGVLFIIGVVCFAAAHILFSAAFCKPVKISRKDILTAAGIFVPVLGIIIAGGMLGNDYQGLFPVLTGYAAIISFMVANAFSLSRSAAVPKAAVKLIKAGAVLFITSDILLLFWLFGSVPKIVQSVNWVTYFTAQCCLAMSLGKIKE